MLLLKQAAELGEPPEESRQDYLNQILKVSRAKNKELRLKKQQAEASAAAAAKPKGEPTEVEVEPLDSAFLLLTPKS